MEKRIRQACLIGLLGGWLAGPLAAVADGGDDIARIKAVYLYHFATFAKWPEGRMASPEIRLCVMGGGDVQSELRLLNDRDLGDGRLLRVIYDGARNLPQSCDMAFVGVGMDYHLMREGLRNVPVLSISDQPGFAQGGGMIEMYLRDDKVRMRINLGAVRASGLQLSSKLLRLAEIVETP